tara:strand:+ start:139 stop:723 length:585 start_codon:yes stop_codon:yes gene_type:complete
MSNLKTPTLNAVQNAIFEHLQNLSSVYKVREWKIGKLPDRHGHLHINLETNSVSYSPESMKALREKPEVYLTIALAKPTREEETREVINGFINVIIKALYNQKLGFAMKGIKPKIWRNVTSEKMFKAGYYVVQLTLDLSWVTSENDLLSNVIGDLDSIFLDYYLVDAEGGLVQEDDGQGGTQDRVIDEDEIETI